MPRCNISFRAIKTWFHTQVTEKQHLIGGLDIVLVVTTLTTIFFASTFTRQTSTEQISKPSLQNYEELLVHHFGTLQCPCVRPSIPYNLFMNFSVSSRHQVCSSSFITNEWVETLLLPDRQTSYSPRDFQKTAAGFFQLLASLCELSQQYLTDELSDLMRRSLINRNAISRLQLDEKIQSIINQFQLNTPASFLTTLQLIRAMISDNTLMSVFETNWQWVTPSLYNPSYWRHPLYTQPIVYNGSCNCGLSSQCVQESSTMPGLMVGCYPLESLLKSTLECLYNTSCFSLLQSISRSFAPLKDSSSSRYQKNSTVDFILSQLMVEQWTSSVIYENYYAQCAPSLCSYITRRPALQVLTLLLGLLSGLTIIMNVVAFLLVTLWQEVLMKLRRGRHDTQIHPMSQARIPTVGNSMEPL